MLSKGQVHTLTVTGYASDGAGVGRIDGQVVFVRGALRGETCRVTVEHVGHRAAWAGLTQVLAPSPARVEPGCPHAAQCGGCQLRHMSYAEELDFKRGKVEDALRRVGGLDLPVSAIHGAPSPDRYRNKVQFPAAPGPRLGFYALGTHKVADVPDCLLQPPSFAQVRRAVLDYMTAHRVPPYDESAHTGLLRHLYIRSDHAGGLLVCLLVNGPSLPDEAALVSALRAVPHVRGVVLGVNTSGTNVILGERYRTLWGADHLLDTLCGLTFKLSVPSFYQVNHAQTEVLYGLVARFAALTGTERVVDLYCGAGTIGLTLAAGARELLGVEIIPQAIRDAEENARRNGIANARFLCADAAQAAQQLAREGTAVDLAVVDPPRKGLAPQVVAALPAIAPRRLIYVSCDPATLARDLKLLAPHFTPREAQCVDMFPRTHHVETVCLLSRKT